MPFETVWGDQNWQRKGGHPEKLFTVCSATHSTVRWGFPVVSDYSQPPGKKKGEIMGKNTQLHCHSPWSANSHPAKPHHLFAYQPISVDLPPSEKLSAPSFTHYKVLPVSIKKDWQKKPKRNHHEKPPKLLMRQGSYYSSARFYYPIKHPYAPLTHRSIHGGGNGGGGSGPRIGFV